MKEWLCLRLMIIGAWFINLCARINGGHNVMVGFSDDKETMYCGLSLGGRNISYFKKSMTPGFRAYILRMVSE